MPSKLRQAGADGEVPRVQQVVAPVPEEEFYLSPDLTEAACTVRLPACPSATGDRSVFNMCWRDCVFHLAGYMLNGHPDGPSAEANIAISVQEIVFEEELHDMDTFQVYTHMSPTETGFIGDVYVFRGQKLVALCSDMVYKTATPRRGATSVKKTAAAAAAAAVFSASAFSASAQSSAQLPRAAMPLPSEPRRDNVVAVGATAGQPNNATTTKEVNKPQDVADLLLELIANETGWPVDVLEDNTELADMGVDSLMNIVLVSKIRAEKDIEILATKFRQCFTPLPLPATAPEDSVAEHADVQTGPEALPDRLEDDDWGDDDDMGTPLTNASTPVDISRPDSTESDMSLIDFKVPKPMMDHVVEDFLIEGEEKEGVPYLFLFPDGSGLVTSFFQLPDLSTTNLCVYGLHSPWVKNPEDFTCTIEQATNLYLAAIRARQP
ncbi:Bikaverin polyketide synthase bik1 [Colletotrichum higginsianum]|uniref:Bikaverin polyketide synthase bik1 n=1 Tax=Colletotrichum higginsianum TaxID=80884 RepID=A0A4T0VI47_9PEZI|nr:Bikaverin polyketide synthase bik1 [Colletotrichum higginsianum]